jgi:hypothetical protein
VTDTPNIYAAMSAAMDDVQVVRKDGKNTDQGYNFRGIDAVVNALGPVLRKHRIVPVPHKTEAKYRDVLTSREKRSRECTVTVTYRFYGPAGDYVEAEVPGESMDFGDKGAPKAMSVAYRIALLQVFCIPTDETDPDQHSYERAPEPPPVDPATLELNETKSAVAAAWVTSQRGDRFDKAAAEQEYARWSGGELLESAAADRLREFANYLTNTPPEPSEADAKASVQDTLDAKEAE